MVSIICAVKNREKALILSLTSWLMFDEVSEIIIVDWNSDKNLKFLTNLDKRIKIIRVDNKKYFNLPMGYNLASDFVTNEFLLKMDADYILNPYYDFIKESLPRDDCFITGCKTKSWCPFFIYLNGLLFIKTENFRKIKGYNENLIGYGYDDDDIHIRLENFGLKRELIDIDPKKIFHIPHENESRVLNYECKNIQKTCFFNKLLSKRNPANERKIKWSIKKINNQYFIAEEQK